MKPVLLYDGYCNFCITLAKFLEFLNFEFSSRQPLSLIPFQSANFFKEKYSLTGKELSSQIHLITAKGKILRGSEAIVQLGEYFPSLKLILGIFKTSIGKSLYGVISRNRSKIMGCSKSCYISPQV